MNHQRIRFLLLILLSVSLFNLSPLVRDPAQAVQDPGALSRLHAPEAHDQDGQATADDMFIIYSENGRVGCRHPEGREAAELRAGRRDMRMRALSGRRESLTAQGGFKIILRGTPQLEDFPAAKEAFLRAAATWESIIQSDVTVIIDVDYGPTLFGSPFGGGTIGGTFVQTLAGPEIYPAVRERLIAAASNPQESELYQSLPAGTISTELGNVTALSAASPNLRVLGLINPVADPETEPANFGSPPAMGFNSNFTFDFDPSDGIDADKTDFDAVATHEIGHALGFITGVGSRELSPTATTVPRLWDLFRFRPGITLAGFATAPRVQLSGGEQVFFAGGNEFGLSTGRNNQTGGDQRQGSHWKEDDGTVGTGQYLGIMDPTIAGGTRKAITAAELSALDAFGFRVRPDATVTEEISADDSRMDTFFSRAGALVVNRLTPARYPATLRFVRIRIPVNPSPAGSQIRLVAFNDPARTGQPPANPQLIFDQTLALPVLPASSFFEFKLSDGPTIASGDLYVGFQSADGAIRIAADVDAPRGRSFISADNGATFQPLQLEISGEMRALNFIGRAVVSASFGNNAAPAIQSLSPSAVAPGSQAFTLYVNGTNFLPGSVVRWNGQDRPTTLINGAQLQAQIPAADVAADGSAAVTVVSPEPGGGPSNQLEVRITGDNPVPTLTRLSPGQGAVGGAEFMLAVTGTGFLPASVVRWKGQDRPTTFVNSTQVTAQIPAGDLAELGAAGVTVLNPGPGGGASNALNFGVIGCNFTLTSATTNPFSGNRPGGLTVNVESPCAWTAQTDVPWITFTGPTTGVGVGVITYAIAANPDPRPRAGRITIGRASVTVRQAGLLAATSGANFAPALAPEAIASVFGADLSGATATATTQPLPTQLKGTSVAVTDSSGATRAARLFFVSPGQINFVVPAGTRPGTVNVLVLGPEGTVATGEVAVTSVAPGIFTANQNGQGVPAAIALRVAAGNVQTFEPVVALDGVQNRYLPRPIDLGPETDRVSLILFGTGLRGRASLDAVQIDVGGMALQAQFAGAQPEFAGLDQINVELPRSLLGRGEVTVGVTVGGRAANPVTVVIR